MSLDNEVTGADCGRFGEIRSRHESSSPTVVFAAGFVQRVGAPTAGEGDRVPPHGKLGLEGEARRPPDPAQR